MWESYVGTAGAMLDLPSSFVSSWSICVFSCVVILLVAIVGSWAGCWMKLAIRVLRE